MYVSQLRGLQRKIPAGRFLGPTAVKAVPSLPVPLDRIRAFALPGPRLKHRRAFKGLVRFRRFLFRPLDVCERALLTDYLRRVDRL